MFCIFFKKFLFLKILNHNNTIHGHTFSRLSLVYVNIMNVFSFPPFCQFTNYLRDPLNHPLTHAGGLEENYEDLPRILPRFFSTFSAFFHTNKLARAKYENLVSIRWWREKTENWLKKRRENELGIFFFFLYIFFQLDKVNSNWGQQQKIQLFFVLIIFALNNLCGILLGDEKQF